jgi:hypothetical protein
MEAVSALYQGTDVDLTGSILKDLSQQVFHGPDMEPAGAAQRFMARLSHRLLKATTRIESNGPSGQVYQNRLLQRSGHPYARALLNSTSKETASLVEGGDPMNGPYLMLAPSIRANGDRWDHLFFNSVQGKDVQFRFIRETRATYEQAKAMLESGRPVRLKAVAAGTGLSLILAYDKLMQEGHDPSSITALITDRDSTNTAKTKHLLHKLASTQGNRFTCSNGYGIAARTEDLFRDASPETAPAEFDIVTAVGILEYFEGTSSHTTRERLGLPAPEGGLLDSDLAARLSGMTAAGGHLIINTYRDHASVRILELFGKRFTFRDRTHLAALLEPHGFKPFKSAGSANIYDVEVYINHAVPTLRQSVLEEENFTAPG